MKKLLKITLTLFTLLILLLGFALPLNPAGNWYQQFLPNIGSQQIRDIYFLDSLTGYAVTSRNVNPDTSSILKTTNGGDNWQIIFTQTPKRFSKVHFINQNTGFVCGGSGGGTAQFYKTTNAGVNWTLVSSFGCAFWNDMFVLNNDTIWLVDSDAGCGGVFRTVNGGTNWSSQGNFGSSNPSHIYMYNARIGFIDGLKKTTDGGASWNPIAGSEPSLFFDMYFTDSLTGWKCHQQMRKTTNGGLNWINQTVPTGGNIVFDYMLKFHNLNKDTIWGCGGVISTPTGLRGMLFRTLDGGNNWQFQIPDTAIHSGQYQHVQFIDKLKGWSYWPASGVHTTLGGDPVWYTGLQQISNEIPKDYKIFQNYPNPFNPKTNIKYSLTNRCFVNIIVFDVTGKEITDLVNQVQNSGTYQVDFSSIGLSSGIYFYTLIIDGFIIDTKKMILLK